MPTVVSNTSPLNYLILTAVQQILPTLFGELIIPSSVAGELSHPRAPAPVKSWIAQPPTWLRVVTPVEPAADLPRATLGPGERDTVLIALELQADIVLMDDREGSEEAQQRGLKVVGTLGVLDRAAECGLIDLPDVVSRLMTTNFRAAPALIQRLLARHFQR